MQLLASILVAASISGPAAKETKAPWPAWWYTQAMCIHRHESVDWHKTTDWRGYPSRDHGGMQIDVDTWRAHGGVGDPASASPYQQLVIAYKIWKSDGGSWREWPRTSIACGLR